MADARSAREHGVNAQTYVEDKEDIVDERKRLGHDIALEELLADAAQALRAQGLLALAQAVDTAAAAPYVPQKEEKS